MRRFARATRRSALAAAALAVLLVPFVTLEARAQRQQPDNEYAFANQNPAYAAESGPLTVLSGFSSPMVGRGAFEPLVRLARTDGFRFEQVDGRLEQALAANPAILVVANAYAADFASFPAMEPPSAFDEKDIEAVRKWVEAGGGLLILADHAPFGGGASDLAAAFGFTFLNGHAVETRSADSGYVHVQIDFTPQNGLDTGHAITDGATGRKPVGHFFAFGGQAMIPPDGATTLLRIPDGWSAIFSYAIERELKTAPRIDAGGMAQGAVVQYGKGRVAAFAEAGGFSAQVIDGSRRFGFNSPDGGDNPEFVLAVLRWLAGFRPGN